MGLNVEDDVSESIFHHNSSSTPLPKRIERLAEVYLSGCSRFILAFLLGLIIGFTLSSWGAYRALLNCMLHPYMLQILSMS